MFDKTNVVEFRKMSEPKQYTYAVITNDDEETIRKSYPESLYVKTPIIEDFYLYQLVSEKVIKNKDHLVIIRTKEKEGQFGTELTIPSFYTRPSEMFEEPYLVGASTDGVYTADEIKFLQIVTAICGDRYISHGFHNESFQVVNKEGCYYGDDDGFFMGALISNYCSCGRPEDVIAEIHKVIRTCSGYPFKDGIKNIDYNVPPQFEMIKHLLDAKEYIQHGFSIYGGWLTPKGVLFAMGMTLNVRSQFDYCIESNAPTYKIIIDELFNCEVVQLIEEVRNDIWHRFDIESSHLEISSYGRITKDQMDKMKTDPKTMLYQLLATVFDCYLTMSDEDTRSFSFKNDNTPKGEFSLEEIVQSLVYPINKPQVDSFGEMEWWASIFEPIMTGSFWSATIIEPSEAILIQLAVNQGYIEVNENERHDLSTIKPTMKGVVWFSALKSLLNKTKG